MMIKYTGNIRNETPWTIDEISVYKINWQEILERIMQKLPIFEKLIIDLLQAMGYGVL